MRLAITDDAEVVFDTGTRSRKMHNIQCRHGVALVIGWEDHVSVQLEGTADIPTGEDHELCVAAYLTQHPDMLERSKSSHVAHVRVRPRWIRYADYRPEAHGTFEFAWTPDR